ncbi:Fumagillin beta-trans-bergamotene synthase [Colletotrichum aenigma]|uniref:Fumagillin beta-trans-bergamotene synthase n=1 Tax=Colletotrichum aenigma TaxID=1215731 RepID=UPI00187247D0|nr:Fumagillin beta-trans-bergamotene synthase [Colletotrichum aenigma]KAF5525541.1 Fumagillin beta-trans-bergamotene synthase [Colletotrichum aenigma]
MGKINIESCPKLSMEEESMGFHLDEKETLSRSRRSTLYHLKTLYLFTKSDCKTVVIPQMLFAISSILTNGFRNLDTLPTLTLTTFFKPLIHAVIWIYANLLLENLANQRLPGSMIEDAANKSWRPLPSGRITADQTRRIALYLVPSLMIFGAYSGAFRETTSFIAFVWMYNDLDAADTSIWWRNIANALGLMAFSAGALAITGGTVEHLALLGKTAAQTSIQRRTRQSARGIKGSLSRTLAIILGSNIMAWPSLAILKSFGRDEERLRMAEDPGPTASHGIKLQRMMGGLDLLLPKPDPGIAAMAIVAFGAGVCTMYHLNRDDELQDKILAAGMTLAFIAGTILGYDAEAIILNILPWTILLALSLSAIVHQIWRYMAWTPRSCDSGLPIWTYS